MSSSICTTPCCHTIEGGYELNKPCRLPTFVVMSCHICHGERCNFLCENCASDDYVRGTTEHERQQLSFSNIHSVPATTSSFLYRIFVYWVCTFSICMFIYQHFSFVLFEDVSMNRRCSFTPFAPTRIITVDLFHY